ncbi:MAG: redoxin domain-containing protein [Alphaproteobacteria bacterium]|nr:redoxin domain-containing protein [Alphaproteobacteria bacterium]
MIAPGDPAPWFVGRTHGKPHFHFDTVAGRYIVLSFFASTRPATQATIVRAFRAGRNHFDDKRACFFGITIDPEDKDSELIKPLLPGMRFFLDFDMAISAKFELCTPVKGHMPEAINYTSCSMVLDPRMRVLAVFDMRDPAGHASAVLGYLSALPDLDAQPQPPAPVLVVPRLFEPDFCGELIAAYLAVGGDDSGFMREVNGKTTGIIDHVMKKRADCFLHPSNHKALINGVRQRLHSRLFPEVQRAFQFAATRIERYVIACYDSDTGGYFRPHRDNTTRGTSHRRFAVSINLNSEDYVGCDLRFPEFGPQTYRPPTGGALVFSCSLLHEATRITSGRRFACLPFLYDEDGEATRIKNLVHVDAEGAIRHPPPSPHRDE